MKRPSRLLLAGAVASAVAAGPATGGVPSTEGQAPAGASIERGTFPIGVCVWARPVSGGDSTCVIVNDPGPWLP